MREILDKAKPLVSKMSKGAMCLQIAQKWSLPWSFQKELALPANASIAAS